MKNGWISKQFIDGATVVTEMRRKPTAAEWARFGRIMDELQVWDWQNYDRQLLDGHFWQLTCELGPEAVHASGRNAYPQSGDPRQTAFSSDTLNQFRKALEQLVNPKPEPAAGAVAIQSPAREPPVRRAPLDRGR